MTRANPVGSDTTQAITRVPERDEENAMRTFATLGSLTSIALAAGLAAGCASQPDRIAAQSVSPLQYRDYDCAQVGTEMDRVGTRAGALYANLKKTASNDQAQMAIGMLVFWPALFFLEGGDGPEAAEYARLKGEFDALEATAVQKKCTFDPPKRIADYLPATVQPPVQAIADPGQGEREYDPRRGCADMTTEERLMSPNRFCGQ
jgi:hypothetical protein